MSEREAAPTATSPPVLDSLGALPAARRVVTIGTFDGVHRGHRSLLGQTVARARELGVPALAVTFEPIPALVLRPDRFAGRICPPADKLLRIAEAGLDEIAVLAFTPELSRQTPEEFLGELAERASPIEIWVGEAFALGKNRVGDVARIAEIGAGLGFAVRAVRRLENGTGVISSSAIRRAIQDGEVALARTLLGRPFRVSGEVVHGAHLGRTIGYPTANVVPPPDLVPLADGIYASWTTLPDGAGPRPAMTYVGTRPTVNTGDRLVETHLLDFDGDLYGQVIHVDVLERLRPDATFAGLDALVAQLRADEAATRAFLAIGQVASCDGG
ncbi:MAG: FMN adenylyltransferase / Riboflavin kinase [uncultured Thermomicrobiales bacterium]|uniref:Riboflavin biosynthesis protein n=1 Tax=uncultured Thermomicrobiales bacterium TaxID=1645740 RepID=A0A6J4U810_9BACT|nr:MAG: FMN adenylyltransferase / Riboflavin kinase [uncultured Thermomicrobiales bacterium]